MKKMLFSILGSLLLVLLVATPIFASQPYVGGYLDQDTIVYGQNFIMRASFPSSFTVPNGTWVGPVLSLAGANSDDTLNGKIHQSGLLAQPNGSVSWSPQVWYLDSQQWFQQINYVGNLNTKYYYTRIQNYDTTVMRYWLYVYDTAADYSNDDFRYYCLSNTNMSQKFPIGDRTYNGVHFRHIQFGIEGNQIITNAWQIVTDKVGFYGYGNWQFIPARATRGDLSYITWVGTTTATVGGSIYTGAQAYSVGTDTVTWKRTGTTQTDNASLWTGSGTISDSVTGPYAVDFVAPVNFKTTARNMTSVSLSWQKGMDTYNTIVRRSTTGYPTSPTSGTGVYNGTGTSCTDSGLTANTLYYYSAWGQKSDGTYSLGYACLRTSTLGNPTIINLPATNITRTSATLNGQLTDTGDKIYETNVNVKVYFGLNDGGTTPANWGYSSNWASTTVPAVVQAQATGLTPGTKYYYRWYAQNIVGYDWADSTSSFTTLP